MLKVLRVAELRTEVGNVAGIPEAPGGGGPRGQITGAPSVMLGVGSHPKGNGEPLEGFHQGSGQTA